MDDALNRLVAFGCSITYGAGLPDYVDPGMPNFGPSKYAWPALVAKSLNLAVVNKSSLGASNLKILNEILNFDFNSDDTVVIMWSFYQRDMLYYNDKIVEIGHWVENDIAKSYYEAHSDYDMAMKSAIHIHHADLFLKNKNIKALHLIKNANDDTVLKNLLKDKNLKWFDTTYHDMVNEYIDLGSDNRHPGLKTHVLMSKIILSKLKENK